MWLLLHWTVLDCGVYATWLEMSHVISFLFLMRICI